MKKEKTFSAVIMFALLLGFWIIIESEVTILSLTLGFLATLFVIVYIFDLIFSDQERTRLTFRSAKAFFILLGTFLKEVLIANIQVAKIVLSKNMNLSPKVVKIKQPLKKDLNRAFYGNFITLTPGTLTIDSTEEYLIVHGLTKDHVKDLSESPLQKAFVKFEGDRDD